jgi:hypothetical protein
MSKTNDSPKIVGGDSIQITIGDQARGVAAGKDVHQVIGEQSQVRVTEADLATVRELFAELKRQVEAQAPPESKHSAKERVEELEEVVTAKKPDLTTIEYVKKWFDKHLPQLAGAVVSVLVNPIVGKVVEATGEIAANELKRLFGQSKVHSEPQKLDTPVTSI